MRLLKPIPTFALFGSLALGLAACPIWGDDDGNYCDDYYDGGYGDCCYGDCYYTYCSSPAECSSGEVCGADNQCHWDGACDIYGCAYGYVCDERFTCVPGDNIGGSGPEGGAGGSGGGEGGAGGGGPDPIYCGHPGDCSADSFCAPDGTCHTGDCSAEGCIFGFYCDTFGETPTCMSENPAACGTDAECGGDGNRCVSGICTAPADQCFDGTQCSAGDVCADGKCTASCAGSAVCEDPYSCTATVELCTTPIVSCTITNDCGGPDTVCVDGACVPRAIGGVCNDASDVWVQNGCVPDQSAIFVCAIDGDQDVCASGSLCLHHSCYISCETPNDTACDGLPEFDICKDVTTPSGAHSVCGSAGNLGDECDPTANLNCNAGAICVDGYCK